MRNMAGATRRIFYEIKDLTRPEGGWLGLSGGGWG